MSGKYGILGFLSLSLIVFGGTQATHAVTPTNPAATKPVQKTQPAKQVKRHRSHARHVGLVPPPPAYMPSILPELAVRHSGVGTQVADARIVEKKPENPYKKYINTPYGEAPMPVQSRKGVSTWTPRS